MAMIVQNHEYNFKRTTRLEIMYTITTKEGGKGTILGVASNMEDARKIQDEV